MGFYVTKFLMKEYEMDDVNLEMNKLCGNGYIIPAKKYYKGRYKKRGDDRPKRYLIPTWSPSIDHTIMNKEFEDDMMTVKSIRSLAVLLYD